MKALKTFLFLFLTTGLFNGVAQKKEQKEIHKEIDVNPGVMVEIENQFGDLNISSWEENRVVIDVVISVKGYSESKIEEKLGDINVYFDLKPDHIVAKTKIEDRWSFKLFNNSRLNFRIDYTIKMPRSGAVDLKNDYGSIVLNSLDGKAMIRCDYGKMLIGELNADDNFIAFDYTSNSSFDFIRGGSIRADFSGFEVEEAGKIDIKADYTSAEFKTLQELTFQNDYGKLIVDKINKISGNGDYLTFKVGTLFKELKLNNEFGVIRVEQIMPSATVLEIDSEYTGIQVGISEDWDFQHEIDLDFASLKNNLDLIHNIKRLESVKKYYKGYYGNQNSNNTLKIASEFGSVKLISKTPNQ